MRNALPFIRNNRMKKAVRLTGLTLLCLAVALILTLILSAAVFGPEFVPHVPVAYASVGKIRTVGIIAGKRCRGDGIYRICGGSSATGNQR